MKIRTYGVLTRARLGYRGAFLLFLVVVDLIYGWFLVHPTPELTDTAAFIWRERILPTQAWGGMWLTVGVILVAQAFMRQDRVGYGAAIAMKLCWASVAAASGIVGSVPSAWASVVVWAGFAGLTLLESRRAEPVRIQEITVIDTEPEGV